jgi:hypothetical protein
MRPKICANSAFLVRLYCARATRPRLVREAVRQVCGSAGRGPASFARLVRHKGMDGGRDSAATRSMAGMRSRRRTRANGADRLPRSRGPCSALASPSEIGLLEIHDLGRSYVAWTSKSGLLTSSLLRVEEQVIPTTNTTPCRRHTFHSHSRPIRGSASSRSWRSPRRRRSTPASAPGKPALAVRFDPRQDLKTIRAASPDWDRLAAEIAREMDGNELAVVPVLQFPVWVEPLPPEIEELADRGFETVVRVPFRAGLCSRLIETSASTVAPLAESPPIAAARRSMSCALTVLTGRRTLTRM